MSASRHNGAPERRNLEVGKGLVWGKVAIIGLVVALALLVPARVWAIANADTFTIVTARAYGSTLQSGDILLVVHYDIDYDWSLPTGIETATEAYLGHYYDASASSVRRSTAPFLYVRSGYGQGVMSIYLNPTDVTTYGITWGDPDSAQITGNPSLFPAPQSLFKTIDWRVQTNPASTLVSDIRTAANNLENRSEWSGAGVDLILGDFLQAAGKDYFTSAIPNLKTMAPGVFSGAITNPDFTEREHGSSYADTLENFFGGSALDGAFDSWATWWNLPVIMLKSMMTLLVAVVAIVFVVRWTNEPVAAIPVIGVVLAAGALLGTVALQLVAVVGFFGLLLISWNLWLKRA